jgi:hypothetical protein
MKGLRNAFSFSFLLDSDSRFYIPAPSMNSLGE